MDHRSSFCLSSKSQTEVKSCELLCGLKLGSDSTKNVQINQSSEFIIKMTFDERFKLQRRKLT